MKFGLIGYGKMGNAIHAKLNALGFEDIIIIDRDDSLSNLEGVDVAIEFSTPESAFQNISYCLEHKIPVVSGTTGWLDKLSEIETLAKSKGSAFFYASNFSIGMNIVFEINQRLAQLIPNEYQLTMEEIHHTEKKDSPSGTAITLAEAIINNNEKFTQWKNESTLEENTIPIISKRIEEVPGTHVMNYESTVDIIRFSHEAKSREGFVLGAIKAAQWLVGKKGVFNMSDLLQSPQA